MKKHIGMTCTIYILIIQRADFTVTGELSEAQ